MFRKTHALWLAGAVVIAGSVVAQASPAMAKTLKTGFQASAYGTQVNVDSTVQSGRSALSVLGCVSQPGVTHTNTAASVNAPPALSTGTINTSAASETVTGGVASAGSSEVQSVSLLSGLVAANTVTSVSTTSRDSSTGAFGVSATGTQFLGLTVAGVPVSSTPAPNTKITLPGVGYVVLNQQTSHVGSSAASLTVIGIHVVVTITTPLAAAGTDVEVSFATSSLGGPVQGLLSGLAYGASAHVGGTVIAGEQFPQPMPCLGTHGNTLTNAAASVTIPGVLVTGTVSDTVNGIASSKTVSGEVTSTVQNLNLLGGMVTATAIKADVTAAGSPPALGDTSSFVGLSVAGQPGIGDNVPPNTKVPLAGIGTLWLHRVIQTGTGITVIMVQLVVTVPSNPTGLTPGTTVNVAFAQVGVN
jgi:hypothetical protein